MCQSVLDLNGFVLKYVQIFAVNFHRERTFQSGQRFIHGIFGGLRVVEDDAGEGGQALVDRFGQFILVADIAVPGFVLVRFESDVELTIEEAGRIGAVIGAAQLRADHRDLRIGHQDVANLRRDLAGFFERDGVRHGGAHPERAFVEMRHEFAADERDQQERRAKDQGGNHQSRLRLVQRPVEVHRVFAASSIQRPGWASRARRL